MGIKAPTFVDPATKVSDQVKSLTSQNVIPTIQKFLSGEFDLDSQTFSNILDIFDRGTAKDTDELTKRLLQSQGAQRIQGGAAGQQLSDLLQDVNQQNADRKQGFLLDTIMQGIENRKFGVGAGQQTRATANQFALGSASQENQFNLANFQNQIAARNIRKSEANTFRNIGVPILKTVGGLALTAATGGFGAGVQGALGAGISRFGQGLSGLARRFGNSGASTSLGAGQYASLPI